MSEHTANIYSEIGERDIEREREWKNLTHNNRMEIDSAAWFNEYLSAPVE